MVGSTLVRCHCEFVSVCLRNAQIKAEGKFVALGRLTFRRRVTAAHDLEAALFAFH